MGRRLRCLLANRLVEVTCRTTQGRFLLRPSSAVNQAILACLGRAQRYSGMVVVAHGFLSNHYHLLLVPVSEQQLARFMQFLNTNIAKQVGRLNGWSGPFWGRRYQAIPVSEDDEDQIARLIYLLEQGVKEGLVARPQDWPGVNCAVELAQGTNQQTGIWHERSRIWRAAQAGVKLPKALRQTREVLTLSPLPAWASKTAKQYREAIRELIAAIEERARGRKPLGARAVLAQHPHDRPEHSNRSPAPLCHASDKQTWLGMRTAYYHFVRAYRRAALEWKAGRPAEFPLGAFLPSGMFPARAGPIPSPV